MAAGGESMPVGDGPLVGGLAVKWRVLVGGFLSYMFDALDFTLLAMALPLMIKELNITMADAGLLGTATLLGVGLSGVIMGWFSDSYGRRLGLMSGIAVFGVFTVAVAFAPGYYSILVLRFIAGFGLGGIFGIIAALIVETWPAKQSGFAAAFAFSSWPIGFGSAALAAGYVLPRYGWRALFLFGGASLLALLYIYLYVPESQTWLEQQKSRKTANVAKAPIGEIFSPALFRLTIFGTLSSSFALLAYWGVNLWVPTFLVTERGMDIARMGGTITVPLYAWVTDQTVLFWMGPLMACFFTYSGIFGSYFAKLYPMQVRSLGAGFCFNVGRGFSALSPYLLGFVATQYGLAVGIGMCGGSFALAGLMMLFLPEAKD